MQKYLFTNFMKKLGVCRATLLRSSLIHTQLMRDPKQDPDLEPKNNLKSRIRIWKKNYFGSTTPIIYTVQCTWCRKRRGQQLKKWAQREREYNQRKKVGEPPEPPGQHQRIHFVPAVMLLESAARYSLNFGTRYRQCSGSRGSTSCLPSCCSSPPPGTQLKFWYQVQAVVQIRSRLFLGMLLESAARYSLNFVTRYRQCSESGVDCYWVCRIRIHAARVCRQVQ